MVFISWYIDVRACELQKLSDVEVIIQSYRIIVTSQCFIMSLICSRRNLNLGVSCDISTIRICDRKTGNIKQCRQLQNQDWTTWNIKHFLSRSISTVFFLYLRIFKIISRLLVVSKVRSNITYIHNLLEMLSLYSLT